MLLLFLWWLISTPSCPFPRNYRCLSSIPCLSFAENATRLCHSDGHWDNYTDYDRCSHLPPGGSPVGEFEPNVELPTIIYYTGYTISLISLTLAVAVFLHFK